MNLLMVDDDILTLQDLTAKLDWSAHGVGKIYTAQNAEAALTLMGQLPINIVLCDIEMPGENGLELLAQIRCAHPTMPCILLTSYARFEYAQQAIQLNIMEYLLKPISAGHLASAVDNAVSMVHRQQQELTAQKHGQYWVDEKRNSAEYFWLKALRGLAENLHDLPQKLGYTESDTFVPILIEVFDGKLSAWSEPMLEYAMKNVGYEFFCSDYLAVHAVVTLPATRWLAVLSIQQGPQNLAAVAERVAALVSTVKEMLDIELAIAMGELTTWSQMQGSVAALTKLLEGSMDRGGRIFTLSSPQTAETYTTPKIAIWEAMLQNKDVDTLLAKIEAFLQGQASTLSKKTMLVFRQDIAQMVYSFLNKNEIQSHLLFASEESDKAYSAAPNSIEDMLAYCRMLIEQSISYINFSANTQSVVHTVLEYLNANYTQEIQRADLAKIVFISPDYLSRLFKKETGQSLMQYVINKRIDAARHLLSETSIPINGVAMQVGFASLAYFSKVFKEATGATPMAYRKTHKNQ